MRLFYTDCSCVRTNNSRLIWLTKRKTYSDNTVDKIEYWLLEITAADRASH